MKKLLVTGVMLLLALGGSAFAQNSAHAKPAVGSSTHTAGKKHKKHHHKHKSNAQHHNKNS